ncbi:Uncharacterized protein APZ42_020776 [Daphnia magna]|uniref:Uncharacterized protein n=1 Tax=Daphnia magna TaxID=35525 RepID=A0A164XDD5_9CRUS|nr:Uncharacterized protein APZ42_020776 [Daphnia magna]
MKSFSNRHGIMTNVFGFHLDSICLNAPENVFCSEPVFHTR